MIQLKFHLNELRILQNPKIVSIAEMTRFPLAEVVPHSPQLHNIIAIEGVDKFLVRRVPLQTKKDALLFYVETTLEEVEVAQRVPGICFCLVVDYMKDVESKWVMTELHNH